MVMNRENIFGSILVTIGDIATIKQGYTFSQRFQGTRHAKWNYFKVSDIGRRRSNKYLYQADNKVDAIILEEIGASIFSKGSIVFPRVGAALLNNNKRILAVDSIVDDNVLVLTVVDNDRCYNEYLYYWLCGQDLYSFCNDGLVPVIASSNVRSKQIALPPLPEQRAIAAALSDVDAHITALEKLIAKKRAVKQGAMRELLTGKRRLPGFDGEWVEKTLEQIMCIRKERINPKVTRNYRCVELEHIEPETGHLLGWIDSNNQQSLKAVFEPGDVLFGKLRPYLKKYYYPNFHGVCSTEFWVFTYVGENIGNRYIYYITQTPRFLESANSTTGTKMPRADWKLLKEIEFLIPNDELEQNAITAILSDMDAEIEALKAKLNKAKYIKQGMMSELLTGRIRLMEQESTAETVTAPKIVELPKPESKGHNQQFDDAVMIAGIVNVLYSDEFPLGRKKVQKCLYLLRRHQDESTAAFKKKAAGPYADEVRYKGGEPIARSAKYIITTTTKDKGTTFARGGNISQALGYIVSWGKQVEIQWVADKLKYKRVDELELLATVDMAICDLTEVGTPVTVVAIKHLIATNAEWKAKLKRQTFSDANITRAIKELQTLLQGGN